MNDQDENDFSIYNEENSSTQFCYVLRSYYSIKDKRVYSPYYVFGSYKWRFLIFPRGNKQNSPFMSVFLECGGPVVDTSPPADGWRRPTKFSLGIVHPSSPIYSAALQHDSRYPNTIFCDFNDNSTTPQPQHVVENKIRKDTSHTFNETQNDWGFPEFAPHVKLNPNHLCDEDYNIVLMARICYENPEQKFSESPARNETGFVGLENRGATGYMNVLLQALYMVNAFRLAVYNIPLPIEGKEQSGSKLTYALQNIFYELQFSKTTVKTKKLTDSFGWDTADCYTQHDVQELKLILCDELVEKMNKISPDKPNTLSTLFQGKLQNYIECANVDYRKTFENSFSDLCIDVKYCRHIYDSFDQYVKVEMMDGDNKYFAEGFEELQDARKGIRFLELPPVLQLHLKRLEYDVSLAGLVKLNDRYEFQPEIDLSRYVENSDGTDIYVLHSVIVHDGDINGGYYTVFIRPEIDISYDDPERPSEWFRFDDEYVEKVTKDEAIRENYGNGGNSNAYALQYLRKSQVPELLKPIEDFDIPEELVTRIEEERKENGS